MKQLEQVHKDVHTLIKQIVLHKSAGEQSQAEALFHQVGPLSDQIIALLDQIETVVKADDIVNIVVLQADGRQFGLVVDGINDTEEIVVKPLGKHFKGIPLFAGATIMGDGRVALILDVLGIAERSGVVSEVRERALAEAQARTQHSETVTQTVLVFSLGKDSRMAIPLSLVARLEEIPRTEIETADGQEVVQYRGEIMPLLRLSNVFGVCEEADQDPLQVVVYTEKGAVSAWWWDASWTLWRRRSTCAAMPAERVCSARWSFNSA